MKHFISYPFWINEVACWSDLKSLNGPVGTENRGVAVFTHWDITQLNKSTFALGAEYLLKFIRMKNNHPEVNSKIAPPSILQRSMVRANLGTGVSV